MRPADWKPLLVFAGIFAALVVAFKAAATLERTVGRATGNFGYTPDPEGTRAFLRELDRPTFRQAGAEVIRGAKGKDAYLYRYADKVSRQLYGKPYGPWNQGQIGTCVSFGWAMGSWVGQCVDYATGGLPTPPKYVATEPIYGGSRTYGRMPPVTFAGYSDGSYGAAAARWVSGQCKDKTVGGILFREPLPGVDLTTYSIPLSKEWGAKGPPLSIAKLANQHTARAVALCETWEGLCAALESGMCVPVCSNIGFASGDRDADGFLRRQSSWGHCMVAISVKYAANNGPGSAEPMKQPRDGVLIMNSWGANWTGGGKHPKDQPDGSFWITRKDAEAILAQGDSFVIGSVNGFKYRDLDNGGWMNPAPIEATARGDK